MTNTTRASIAQVPFGNSTIEGIMLPDGTFAIAFPQVYSLFSVPQKHAARKLKAIADKAFGDFSVPQKVSTELNSKRVNVLTLSEFEEVAKALAMEGNKEAIEFAIMLMGMSLTQLWSDAFGIKFEKEQRQAWLVERQNGKDYRRTLTDATQYLINQGNKLNYGYITLSVYEGSGLLNAYRDYKTVHKDSMFRDTLSKQDLRRLTKMEELTADYVMVDMMSIEDALKKASTYIR